MIKKLLLGGALALIWAGSAKAVTIFTGSAIGSWGTPTGTASGDVYSVSNKDDNISANTSNFDFGTGVPGSYSNLFTFNGANSFTTPGETLFDIGAFSYRNGTTNNYTQFSSVGLSIKLNLSSPISSSNNFTYNFAIDITPNTTGNAVLDGDIVSISNGTTATTFVVGSTVYTLSLKGFSSNGGKTVTTQFLSPENSTATADLFATITTQTLNNVPEPASVAIIGAALVGLGAIRNRRKSI